MLIYQVKTLKYLKIDTEGSDPLILDSMMEYCDKFP